MNWLRKLDEDIRSFIFSHKEMDMKDEQTYKSVGLFRRTVRLLDARITEIELSDDPWQELSRIVAPNPIESESSE